MIAANTPPRRAADGRSGTDAAAIKIVGHRTTLAPRPAGRTLMARASNKGYPKVREDFTIMEKALTRAFPCLKAPALALPHLRFYAKQTLSSP